jgi:hypothetical protein
MADPEKTKQNPADLIKNLGAEAGELFQKVRKSLFIGLISVLVLVFLVLLGYILGRGGLKVMKLDKNKQTSTFSITSAAIDPGELYLPPEPDAIPGLLLGQKRSQTWSPSDAAPYWQDPLKGKKPNQAGGNQLAGGNADIQTMQNTVKGTVDGIMKGVP